MAAGLPHAYPFLFVDRVERTAEGDRAILGVTADGSVTADGKTAGGDAAALPATLLLEAMAQATLALMLADGSEDESGEGRGLLVGIDEATFDEALIHDPPRAGDRLVTRCEVRGRFGAMAKVAAWMERDGVRVASAAMLLARR